MNLLILGLNYAPEPVGIGPFTAGLAEGMAARGHAVTVVAGQPYYPQWRPYPDQPAHSEARLEDGVSVIRVPHYIPETPTIARRLRHYLSFAQAARASLAAAAGRGPDLVLAIAPALLSVPVARRAAGVAGAPLWVHLQDFEAEAMFATGLLGRSALAERAALALERRLLLPAERISSISPQMCARLREKGVPAEIVLELRNWSTLASAGHGDGAAYRREWQLGERHVALYAGIMYQAHQQLDRCHRTRCVVSPYGRRLHADHSRPHTQAQRAGRSARGPKASNGSARLADGQSR